VPVPDRRAAAGALLALDPGPRFIAHASAVAEVAAFIAARIEVRGGRLERPLVEAAALLHDVDKLLPRDDPVRLLGHGYGTARWLTERGFAELAPVVASHPVGRLADDAAYGELMDGPPEPRLVAYADKRAAQRLQPMHARFDRWRRRHPDSLEFLELAWPRALELERVVCAAAGLEPSEVRRLRWTRQAFAWARRTVAAREGAP